MPAVCLPREQQEGQNQRLGIAHWIQRPSHLPPAGEMGWPHIPSTHGTWLLTSAWRSLLSLLLCSSLFPSQAPPESTSINSLHTRLPQALLSGTQPKWQPIISLPHTCHNLKSQMWTTVGLMFVSPTKQRQMYFCSLLYSQHQGRWLLRRVMHWTGHCTNTASQTSLCRLPSWVLCDICLKSHLASLGDIILKPVLDSQAAVDSVVQFWSLHSWHSELWFGHHITGQTWRGGTILWWGCKPSRYINSSLSLQASYCDSVKIKTAFTFYWSTYIPGKGWIHMNMP